jgi:hypothetical protein
MFHHFGTSFSSAWAWAIPSSNNKCMSLDRGHEVSVSVAYSAQEEIPFSGENVHRNRNRKSRDGHKDFDFFYVRHNLLIE